MKILMISPFAKPDVGGVESHIYKLTKYLCEKLNLKVTLLTYMPLVSNSKPPIRDVVGNLETIRMPWFGKGWFRILESYFPLNVIYLFPGLLIRALPIYISRYKEYSAIHAHGFIAGLVALTLCKLFRKRIIISTHAIYSLAPNTFKSKLFRAVLKPFDIVLAVGEPSKKELICIGIPESKIIIHPNWIDLNECIKIPRADARKDLGLDFGGYLVLFVGRMIGIKGELLLLDVAKSIGPSYDIKFMFVGSGPEASKISDASKIYDNVLYLGNVPDEYMKHVYSAADIFVSPVMYDEGFATVYLEALSYGLPVITANRGCLPYFLDDTVSTLLDEITVEKVLETIINNYNERETAPIVAVRCREYAEKNFSELNANIIYESYINES